MMRRILICMTLAAALVSPMAAQAAADAPPLSVPKAGVLDFEVIRNGSSLGDHKFAFHYRGKRLEVKISSDIEYRLLFIPFYTHTHRATEVWQGDRLVAMTAATNDNGEELDLTVEASDGVLRIDGPKGALTAPADAAPASFWSATALKREQVVSTLRGSVKPLAVEFIGEETIEVRGKPRAAKRYKLTGGVNRELWFDAADNMALVYLRFEAKDGSTVEYRLK